MDIVQAVGHLIALTIIIVTLWDMFLAVFSANGAGPLTRIWLPVSWRGLLAIHRRRPIHHLLALAGPAMLLSSIVAWYVLIGLGLWLLLALHPGSVVDDAGRPADLLQLIYFVNTTISSLGYGDWVPSRPPWTFVNTAATFAATVLLTVSLSYVLSVLAASVERRALAHGVFGLGDTLRQWVRETTWRGDGDTAIHVHLLSLASQIELHAHKHQAYPILQYFHASRPELSLPRAVLLLSDVSFVMQLLPATRRPPDDVRRLVNNAVESFAKCTEAQLGAPRLESLPAHLEDELHAVHADGDVARLAADYLPVRAHLLALCHEDGWEEQ